jgi:mechanosensitive ion channel-like protein
LKPARDYDGRHNQSGVCMEQLQGWGAQLIAVLRDTVQDVLTYLPVALAAIAVLIVGWLVARLLRDLVQRALQSMDWLFGRLMARSAGSHAMTRATSRVVSNVVFWIVLFVSAASALRILGGSVFERWTANLLGYLPSAIGGVIIIVIGLVGGALARHIVEQASVGLGIGQSALVGRLAQAVIVISGVVIGIDQFGVNVNFLIQLTTVTAAAVFGGIALVFALGTREHLANLIGAHYARKHYSPGDYVRVGAFEGRIVEITDGCVFLETEQGDVSVPAQHFSQEPFVKLRKLK